MQQLLLEHTRTGMTIVSETVLYKHQNLGLLLVFMHVLI